MADAGWRRPFDEPIPLPRGRQLVTLEDAGRNRIFFLMLLIAALALVWNLLGQ